MIAGTPAHWVTVAPGGGAPNFSTIGHQYFHLDEAKEFCRQIAAGEIDLADLRAQYDAEDEAKVQAVRQEVTEQAKAFRAHLRAKGLSCQELLELEVLHNALGEMGHQILLELEREEKCPGGVEAPPGRASREAYHGNTSIIPRESSVCKGVFE